MRKIKDKSQNKGNKLKRFFIAITLTVLLLTVVSVSSFFAILYLGGPDPDISLLKNASKSIEIYDDDDVMINNYKDIEYAEISEIPENLKNAFIAVEDKRFYSHHGIDYIRIGGALFNNLRGSRTQGASTITQQLVKNTYLTSEQTLDRKLKEMQLAIKIEKELSKDEILEKYLNMLYFGSGEYGVKNACRRFFGKDLSQLNVLECAMLAGIVKSPTKYNPINNYDNSIQRSKVVLRLMYEQNFIDKNIYDSYINAEITIKNTLIENNPADLYLKNAIHEACQILNTDEFSLRAKGIKLYTFYEDETQKLLCSTIDNSSYYDDDATNSVGLICGNYSRGIKAFASRKDINLFEYKRQAGSTIKPLACYAPALDQGLISPLSKIMDEPTSFGDYSPSNYKDSYYGMVSIEDAVAKSLNIPAIKTMQSLGVDTSIEYLNKMGIPALESDNNLALALGGMTYGITMLDLLGGYTTLANYGAYRKPTFIKYIKDSEYNVIYQYDSEIPKRVFDEQSSFLMTSMLMNCAKQGTAKKLSTFDFEIACKTGTVSMSNKEFNSDIYSVGYTSADTFLFWQGDNTLSSNNTGGGVTALMAKNFLSKFYSDIKPIDFAIPNGIEKINIDKYSYDRLDKIVLAGANAPRSTTIETYVSQKCFPTEKDETYDRLFIKDISFLQDNDNINIKFQFNPKLCYRIYKRTFLDGEYVLYDLKNKSGAADISVETDGLLGSKITVIPYYIDDDGKEIIGTPSKYYSTAFAKRLLK